MKIQYGITGNYYVTSIIKEDIIKICKLIFKAESSIYFNKKYKVWTIRIKDQHQKNLLKAI